jgi:hypothetical protein
MQATALMAVLSPMVANAMFSSTTEITADYNVTKTGVLNNASNLFAAKYSIVGGSAATASYDPAFTVEQFSGSAILAALDAAAGTPGAPITGLNSVTLNLYDGDEPPPQYIQYSTSVAGGLAFQFASSAAGLTQGASTPVFDTSAAGGAGGLDTQLGALDSLGTATYTPTVDNTNLAFSLSGTAGYNDILNAINSGSNFYIAVEGTTTTVAADFGGQYGDSYYASNPTGEAYTPSLTVSVPEPASLGILATSGLFLLGRRRRTASV